MAKLKHHHSIVGVMWQCTKISNFFELLTGTYFHLFLSTHVFIVTVYDWTYALPERMCKSRNYTQWNHIQQCENAKKNDHCH